MKVTIDIPDMYVKILSKWASVSRTLNEAKQHCTNSMDDNDPERNEERAMWCLRELETIEPALNALHQLVREQLWIKERDEGL